MSIPRWARPRSASLRGCTNSSGSSQESLFATDDADRALVGPLKHGREFVEVRVEQSPGRAKRRTKGSGSRRRMSIPRWARPRSASLRGCTDDADRALVGPLKHGREFVEVRVEQSRFEDLQQDPSLYLAPWLSTVYIAFLPLDLATRIFDVFLLEGPRGGCQTRGSTPRGPADPGCRTTAGRICGSG
jgi:hypothetical protein